LVPVTQPEVFHRLPIKAVITDAVLANGVGHWVGHLRLAGGGVTGFSECWAGAQSDQLLDLTVGLWERCAM
jgi:hypothetical protein